jgi:hypothetical protein
MTYLLTVLATMLVLDVLNILGIGVHLINIAPKASKAEEQTP